MSNLTKREIVTQIYRKTSLPQKQILAIVQMSLDRIVAALAGGRNVELRNIGVFQVQKRRARVGRNPKLPGSDMIIPPQAVVKFRGGRTLRQLLKKIKFPASSSRPAPPG
jgi:integration host factor subunit beta